MKNKDYTLSDEMRRIVEYWIQDKIPISYSEICQKFNWEKANGNTKRAQIGILEQNYEFDYIGSHSHKKFMFYGIKNKNLTNMVLTKRGEYTKYIDKIIMEKLNISKNGSIDGSYLNIAKQIGLLHPNFFYAKSNLFDVEFSLGFPSYFLNSFLDLVSKRISKILERSFRRLKNAGYIQVKKEVQIKLINSKFTMAANEQDKKNILIAKEKAIRELGYGKIEEIIRDKRGLDYKNNFNKNIKKYGIDFFYEVYIIKKIYEEIESINSEDHLKIINEFNYLFIKNCISNFRKEIEKFPNKEKYKRTSQKTYFELSKFLVECLLDNNSIYDLKTKTICKNGERNHCSQLESGYFWTLLNNIYGSLYIKDFSYSQKK